MPNCANCGQNARRGHAADCDRDTSVSRWVRYRKRKLARDIATDLEAGAPPVGAVPGDSVVTVPGARTANREARRAR